MPDAQSISPRGNNYLLGQEEAEKVFLHAYQSGNMLHAWILSGPQGVGKATLAYRIARFMLTADESKKEQYTSLNVSDKSPIFQQIANGSNPNLMVLERDFIETDRRKIINALKNGEPLGESELATMKKSAFIRVDDVRKVNDFLAKTAYNDGWRVVVIDSADDMNKNAANALLKILEEPPAKTLILLVSNNAGALLPTIRSRCAKLPVKTLSDAHIAALLRRYRSALNETMIAKLVGMSNGSIGKAILYADNDAIGIYEDMCAILYARQNFVLSDLLDFTAQVAADDDKFGILQELVMKFIKDNMINATHPDELYKCWQNAERGFADCVTINTDKRFMLINLFNQICKVL